MLRSWRHRSATVCLLFALASIHDSARATEPPAGLTLAEIIAELPREANSPASIDERIEKSQVEGRTDSEFDLARAFAVGNGVPQNTATAIEWLRKAADGGREALPSGDDLEAAWVLARYRLDGPPSARDPVSAFEYAGRVGCAEGRERLNTTELLRRSLERMDEAQIRSARSKSSSASRAGRYDRGFRPLLALAQHGQLSAQFEVGRLYASALGTQQNLPEAYRWLRLGRAHSPSEADRLSDRIATVFTPEQRVALDRAVSEWRPGSVEDCPGARDARPVSPQRSANASLPVLRTSVALRDPRVGFGSSDARRGSALEIRAGPPRRYRDLGLPDDLRRFLRATLTSFARHLLRTDPS